MPVAVDIARVDGQWDITEADKPLCVGQAVWSNDGNKKRLGQITDIAVGARWIYDKILYNVAAESVVRNVAKGENKSEDEPVSEEHAPSKPKPVDQERKIARLKRNTWIAVWNKEGTDYVIASVEMRKETAKGSRKAARSGKLRFYEPMGNNVWRPTDRREKFNNDKHSVLHQVRIIWGGLLVEQRFNPTRIILSPESLQDIEEGLALAYFR
jgi:hypothetical protein